MKDDGWQRLGFSWQTGSTANDYQANQGFLLRNSATTVIPVLTRIELLC